MSARVRVITVRVSHHSQSQSSQPESDEPASDADDLESVLYLLSTVIGVGTGGVKGAMAPHFSAKIVLKIFPFHLMHNFYQGNDSPGRGEHKSA